MVDDNCPYDITYSLNFDVEVRLSRFPQPDIEYASVDDLYPKLAEGACHAELYEWLSDESDCGARMVFRILDQHPGPLTRHAAWDLVGGDVNARPDDDDLGYMLVKWNDLYILGAGEAV